MADVAILALSAATAYGQVRASREVAKGYAMQATQARVEAEQAALQYKDQAVDVLRNILETVALGTARAGAGGIDPFSGSANTIFNSALRSGVEELYTIEDNTVIALRAGEMQAQQLIQAGKAAKMQGKVAALGTLIAGTAAASSLGGAPSGGSGGGGGSGSATSDRRLKQNIRKVGVSPKGINIYNFEYINDTGVYQGVMSDEVPWAAEEGLFGYEIVDYNKVDVDFVKVR